MLPGGNLARMFGQVRAIVGDRAPICLHEDGPVPDPATLGPDADWLWFMTWHTRWLKEPSQNRPEQLAAYYASDRYLARDGAGAARSVRTGWCWTRASWPAARPSKPAFPSATCRRIR
jgi:hypothetical protein